MRLKENVERLNEQEAKKALINALELIASYELCLYPIGSCECGKYSSKCTFLDESRTECVMQDECSCVWLNSMLKKEHK